MTGWTSTSITFDKNEIQCQQICLEDSTCLFVIHFYQDQDQNNVDTKNRKPLIVKKNTCILKKELKIQNGVKKDGSSFIYYLTSMS